MAKENPTTHRVRRWCATHYLIAQVATSYATSPKNKRVVNIAWNAALKLLAARSVRRIVKKIVSVTKHMALKSRETRTSVGVSNV